MQCKLARGNVSMYTLPGHLLSGLVEGQKCPSAERVSLNFGDWRRRRPMAKFKDTLSALGHFWPSTKPDNKWPGRVYIDTFPRASLHCIGAAPGDGIGPSGRLTLHG